MNEKDPIKRTPVNGKSGVIKGNTVVQELPESSVGKRTTLITGASSGIGLALSERLIAHGQTVVNLSHVPGPEQTGMTTFVVDFTDREATANALLQATSRYEFDNLVNCAGVDHGARIEDIDFDDFDRVISIHVRGSLQAIQAVVPAMKKKKRGRIVSIGSRSVVGRSERTLYSLAKCGLIGVSKCLALELAPFGITVNMVHPGPTETALFRENHKPGSPETEALLRNIPLGRTGQTDDVASSIEYFLSEGASYVTGQNLFVCGGMSLGGTTIS